MDFIKKNKYVIIVVVIFLALVVITAEAKAFLVPDEGKAVYGNRLDDIDKHKIEKSFYDDTISKLKENDKVIDVSYKLHGKIINFMITVNNDVSINDAKTIANSVVPLFKNDELNYYTLQVYVLKEDETLNNFPIIGYKGTESKELVFTKDREITVDEETKDEE